MSGIAGGPNIVRDDIVLWLDGADNQSFRGEPTTNLRLLDGNGQYQRSNYVSGVWTYDGIQTSGEFAGWEKITATRTSTANRLIMLLNGITATANTQYTATIEFISPFNNLTFNLTGNQGIGDAIRIGDTNRYFRTFTKNANTGGMNWYLASTEGNANFDITNGVIYYRQIQWEQRGYPTPWINGTRGTTVATGGGWADLSRVGNHGTLVNNPLFTDENLGGLSFDGTNDSISIPFNASTMDFSEAQTICMWLRPGTGSTSARRNPYNQAYGGSGTITHEMSGGFNYYFGTHGGNSTPYVGRDSGFTVASNELAFISVSRSQSQNICRWYKNGAAGTFSNAGGYASTNNGSSPILIANGYTSRFIGDIYYVAVYNRYMTQQEIQQIYNATKYRFGL
jgi:hypothetical protein